MRQGVGRFNRCPRNVKREPFWGIRDGKLPGYLFSVTPEPPAAPRVRPMTAWGFNPRKSGITLSGAPGNPFRKESEPRVITARSMRGVLDGDDRVGKPAYRGIHGPAKCIRISRMVVERCIPLGGDPFKCPLCSLHNLPPDRAGKPGVNRPPTLRQLAFPRIVELVKLGNRRQLCTVECRINTRRHSVI